MPLKNEQVQNGQCPFDEIYCPLCDKNQFTSLDHASVWCDHCNAQFLVRPTSGDPGYVVDCYTEHIWREDVKHLVLVGETLYCIAKEERPRWKVSSEKYKGWPLNIEEFLLREEPVW